jgi:hypothetical protein
MNKRKDDQKNAINAINKGMYELCQAEICWPKGITVFLNELRKKIGGTVRDEHSITLSLDNGVELKAVLLKGTGLSVDLYVDGEYKKFDYEKESKDNNI